MTLQEHLPPNPPGVASIVVAQRPPLGYPRADLLVGLTYRTKPDWNLLELCVLLFALHDALFSQKTGM